MKITTCRLSRARFSSTSNGNSSVTSGSVPSDQNWSGGIEASFGRWGATDDPEVGFTLEVQWNDRPGGMITADLAHTARAVFCQTYPGQSSISAGELE